MFGETCRNPRELWWNIVHSASLSFTRKMFSAMYQPLRHRRHAAILAHWPHAIHFQQPLNQIFVVSCDRRRRCSRSTCRRPSDHRTPPRPWASWRHDRPIQGTLARQPLPLVLEASDRPQQSCADKFSDTGRVQQTSTVRRTIPPVSPNVHRRRGARACSLDERSASHLVTFTLSVVWTIQNKVWPISTHLWYTAQHVL